LERGNGLGCRGPWGACRARPCVAAGSGAGSPAASRRGPSRIPAAHGAARFTPAAGADAQSTLAFLLTGPVSSLFALAPREAPPVLAPARRFRRTRLAERDGNGQTAPLTLPRDRGGRAW